MKLFFGEEKVPAPFEMLEGTIFFISVSRILELVDGRIGGPRCLSWEVDSPLHGVPRPM